jgi:demethoxyubiquinone hydroxylase (CLK1/Coq7/Cat5 family)
MSRILSRVIIRPESRRFLSSLTSFDIKPEQKTKQLIDKIVRVDQAGELAADRIYAGQMAVLGRTDVGSTIQVYCSLNDRLESILFHLISICGIKRKCI